MASQHNRLGFSWGERNLASTVNPKLKMRSDWTLALNWSGDSMKILVACHGLVMSGGLMRFERFGREAAKLGHHLVYLCRLHIYIMSNFSNLFKA